MEYWRNKKHKIQADFALRVGRIAKQYEHNVVLLDHEEKYEATLTICLLQSLLTICQELIRAMNNHEREKCFFSATFDESAYLWGLNRSMVVIDEFREKRLTYESIINHIRNALSHPTQLNIDSEYASTGFTTLGKQPERISTYAFVSSPDTKNNRPKKYSCKEDLERIVNRLSYNHDIIIKEIPEGRSVRYEMWSGDKPFARIFRIDIPVTNLRQLVLGLSNHLAQPTQEQWDQVTIKEVIAV